MSSILPLPRLVAALALLAVLPPAVFAGALGKHVQVAGRWTTTPPGFNDIWGYTDETGAEYALLTAPDGTWVLNVSDPGAIYSTGFIPGPVSGWRDVKTYLDYAYVVTEGPQGGIQILDLTDPENPLLVPHPTDPGSASTYDGFSTAHNIYIDTENARAYPCGTDLNEMPVLDLTVPTAPTRLGAYDTRYVHDLYVRDNIGYLAEVNANSLTIVDMTDPANIVELGTTGGVSASHNTWVNEAKTHVFVSEERNNGWVRAYDIQDPQTIQLVGGYQVDESNVIPHNAILGEDWLFVSYYTSGLRVLDVSDPTFLIEVAHYDTWPGASGGFFGAWGVYPFLPSGRVLVSDISSGLFVFEVDPQLGSLAIEARDAESDYPVQNAAVQLLALPDVERTDSSGRAGMGVVAGSYELRVRRDGYEPWQQPVQITAGQRLHLDVTMQRVPTGLISGSVTAAGQPLSDALVTVEGIEGRVTTGDTGTYLLVNVPQGKRVFRVSRPGYTTKRVERDMPSFLNVNFSLDPAAWYDDASSDQGWTLAQPTDTATDGFWSRVTPRGSAGGQAQPAVDATPGAGGLCFVTTNAASNNPNDGDVDGGTVTLTSPALAAGALEDPHVSYARWFANALPDGSTGSDAMVVELSDDGSTWVEVERLDTLQNFWDRVELRLADYVSTDASVWIRFVVTDSGDDGMVEAAVDDVSLFGLPPVPAVALRVDLVDRAQSGVQVVWRLSGLVDLDWIEIQRSVGGEFDAIYRVEGEHAPIDGAWTDGDAPHRGAVRYRVVAGRDDLALVADAQTLQRLTIPTASRLLGNVPNPFNPATRLRAELAETRGARLEVLDLRGRLVRAFSLEGRNRGLVEIEWDGRDATGRPVGSGSYMVRLVTATSTDSRTITLVK